MWRKFLEFLGMCKPALKRPDYVVLDNRETLDSLLVLRALKARYLLHPKRGRRGFDHSEGVGFPERKF